MIAVFRYCESRLQDIVKIKLKQPALADLKSEGEEEEGEEGGWRRQLAQSLSLTAQEIYWETEVETGREDNTFLTVLPGRN